MIEWSTGDYLSVGALGQIGTARVLAALWHGHQIPTNAKDILLLVAYVRELNGFVKSVEPLLLEDVPFENQLYVP